MPPIQPTPEVPQSPIEPPVPVPVVPPPAPSNGLSWATTEQIRHSIRVICDEMGLTVEQKNTMCATIYGESEFTLHAVRKNYYKGELVSTDRGLCQWNDYYHGKEITPDAAMNDPERAVRLMAQYWLRGQRNLWVAYSNGSYKKYLVLVTKPMV